MRKGLICTTAVTGILTSALFSAAALAGRPDDRGPSVEQHCAIQLAPVAEGEEESVVVKKECFGTLAESIFVATGGAVDLDLSITAEDLTESMFATTEEASSTVLGIVYTGEYWSGGSWVIYANNWYGCLFYNRYYVPYLNGWDNIISSFVGPFGSCDNVYFYESPWYSHATYHVTGTSSFAGRIMNNNASAIILAD